MNITTENTQTLIIADEPQSRRSPHLMDDLYIEAYLKNPELGKSAALRAAGFDGEHVRQRAYELHRRLQHKIDDLLIGMLNENILIGMTGLRHLAVKSEIDSIRAACCARLVEFGYKYLSKAERRPDRSRAEILEDIKQTQLRISKAQAGVVL